MRPATEASVDLQQLIAALSEHLPPVMRWCGAVAKRLRHFDIAVGGKSSGSPNTDALTLADLTVQELLVAALRDCDPIFRRCRLEAEEYTGDIGRFAPESEYTIALDPIDGTKQYRDKTGDAYAIILSLRSCQTLHYSLVFIPESGEEGTWVEVAGREIRCGRDDPARPAAEVLESIAPIDPLARSASNRIYLIGFQQRDAEKAGLVTEAGLEGYTSDRMPGNLFEFFARGEFGGCLIHTPNVYDFPVMLHMARILGGEALWVHDRQPVHFRELWNDERADMLRLPGIVACSDRQETLDILCRLACDWNPVRYAE